MGPDSRLQHTRVNDVLVYAALLTREMSDINGERYETERWEGIGLHRSILWRLTVLIIKSESGISFVNTSRA